MDAKQSLTATDVVNGYDESQLAAVISQYGEERFARRIAHAIVARAPGRDDARARRRSCATRSRPRPVGKGPHPARRTFQAIRMEVNRELPNLADGLDESVHVDRPAGPRARARVPLARGPHGEGDVRALGRHRPAPDAAEARRSADPSAMPSCACSLGSRCDRRQTRSPRTREPRAPVCARSSGCPIRHDRIVA